MQIRVACVRTQKLTIHMLGTTRQSPLATRTWNGKDIYTLQPSRYIYI